MIMSLEQLDKKKHQIAPKLNHSSYYIFIGLELLKNAIEKAGYTGKIQIGMDVAASGMINHFIMSLR